VGGGCQRPKTAEGDHPSCTERAKRKKEGWGDRRIRPQRNEGLGLDSDGVTRPPINKEKPPAQWADSLLTSQGMEAEWPRLTKNGSVHDSPARRGASDFDRKTRS